MVEEDEQEEETERGEAIPESEPAPWRFSFFLLVFVLAKGDCALLMV